jgi:intracellular septation protein
MVPFLNPKQKSIMNTENQSLQNPSPQNPSPLQQALDIIPLAAFFLSYWLYDLITATAVLIITSLAGITFSLIKKWPVPKKTLFGTAFIAVFGGLTLLFNDETFIKIKASISFSLAGIVFLVALYGFKKNLIHMMLKESINLNPTQWNTLTRDTALFFFLLAAANELVRNTLTTDSWILFKVIGIPIALALFLTASIGFRIARNPSTQPTQETLYPHESKPQEQESPPQKDA